MNAPINYNDVMNINVIGRVKKLVSLFKVPKHRTKKLAFKYLFSSLSALEEIAVLASERGAGVEGQLEDEYVHRDAFKQLAIKCGGFEGACEHTNSLIEYLHSLEGENAMAAINVVAEAWLGCVFVALSNLSPELFDSIGEDEAKHNGYALGYEVPNSEDLEPIMRDLESLMVKIAKSPNFIMPMIYLIGMEAVGRMGLDIVKNHRKACEHLNIIPQTREFEMFCRRTISGAKNNPEPIEMNGWEISKQNLWKASAPLVVQKDIKINVSNEIKVQAKIIEAIYKVTSLLPKFKNVVRDEQIFRTNKCLVGVRALWDQDHLTTIYCDSKQGYKKTIKNITTKIKRVRTRPYEIVPDVHHVKDLLMPSQIPFVISYIGMHDLPWGHGAVNEIEGITTWIFISAPKDNVYTLMFMTDHRVIDGHDICEFTERLKTYIEQSNK
jgi:hypothetical protein